MYNSDKTAAIIKSTAKEKGINLGQILATCGLNRDAISLMSRRGSWLQSNNLAKIADCLDCSTDYLLGRTENPISHKSVSAITTGDISLSNNSVVGDGKVGVSIHNSANTDGQVAALLNAFNSLDPFKQAKVLVYVEELKNS